MAICQLALALDCQLANKAGMGTVNRTRALRKAKDITLERMSELTGVSTTHISRIETGKRGLSLENAILFARALGVPVHEIDEDFADMIPSSGDHPAKMDQEILQILPRLSDDSQKAIFDLARRLENLERVGRRKE